MQATILTGKYISVQLSHILSGYILNSHMWPAANTMGQGSSIPSSVGIPTCRECVPSTIHRKNTVPSYKNSTLEYQLAKASMGEQHRV